MCDVKKKKKGEIRLWEAQFRNNMFLQEDLMILIQKIQKVFATYCS